MMKYVAVALQLILGIYFTQLGYVQLFSPTPELVANFARWGYAEWFITVVGGVELLGGLGLLISLFYPLLAALSALWLGATMVGAVLTHLRVGDGGWPLPLFLLLICIAIARIHVAELSDFVEQRLPSNR